MNTNSSSHHDEETGDANRPQASDHTSIKVLVIDDSIPLLKVLQEALVEFGHTALVAQSGPEALEILRQTKVDVVVCDLGMPDMSGWEVGKAIRDIFVEGRTATKIPFILLTGWASRLTPHQTNPECGVDAVLEKPVDMTLLAQVVKDLAGRERFESKQT